VGCEGGGKAPALSDLETQIFVMLFHCHPVTYGEKKYINSQSHHNRCSYNSDADIDHSNKVTMMILG
jgi:hypothetical protein